MVPPWLDFAMINDTQSCHFGVHMQHLPVNRVSVIVRTWVFGGIWAVISLLTALLALVLDDFIFKTFCCWSLEWFLLCYIYSNYPSLQDLKLLLDISVSITETSVNSLIWFMKWLKLWGLSLSGFGIRVVLAWWKWVRLCCLSPFLECLWDWNSCFLNIC